VPALLGVLELAEYVESKMIVRSPKSARRAWPSRSTRMLTLIKIRFRWWSGNWRSNSYPLQVPMDHPLAMYIQQPPGDAFELPGVISSVPTGGTGGGSKTLRV